MGRIIAFPKNSSTKAPTVERIHHSSVLVAPARSGNQVGLSRAFSFAWILFLLMWPFVQWVVAFDVAFQFLRALYFWNTPGVHAGFTFLIHLFGGAAITFFVATRPIE